MDCPQCEDSGEYDGKPCPSCTEDRIKKLQSAVQSLTTDRDVIIAKFESLQKQLFTFHEYAKVMRQSRDKEIEYLRSRLDMAGDLFTSKAAGDVIDRLRADVNGLTQEREMLRARVSALIAESERLRDRADSMHEQYVTRDADATNYAREAKRLSDALGRLDTKNHSINCSCPPSMPAVCHCIRYKVAEALRAGQPASGPSSDTNPPVCIGCGEELSAIHICNVETREQHIAALKSLLKEARDAIFWMGGSDDFAPGGKAHDGWTRMVQPVFKRLNDVIRE